MALDSEEIVQLAKEVRDGVPPEQSRVADSAEVRAARTKLAREIADIKAAGLEVDLPHEFPELTRITPVRS